MPLPDIPDKKSTASTAELIDIYPTLAELAGLKAPASLQGKSLVSVLKKPEQTTYTPAYTQLEKKTQSRKHGTGI